MDGVVFDIQSYCLYDGPGIRTTVYLKGCPLRCFWCHNPESQSAGIEREREASRPGGEPKIIGASRSVDDVVDEVLKDRAFFDESGGGVTVSGGEPTYQNEFLLALCAKLKERGIHVALETCGSYAESLNPLLARHVDLFLFDLKHPHEARHKEGTGASNQLLHRNFLHLLKAVGNRRITPRIPVIPSFNDDTAVMEETCRWLADNGYQGEVHLMPYHAWAHDKYRRLGRSADFVNVGDVHPKSMDEIRQVFSMWNMETVCYG